MQIRKLHHIITVLPATRVVCVPVNRQLWEQDLNFATESSLSLFFVTGSMKSCSFAKGSFRFFPFLFAAASSDLTAIGLEFPNKARFLPTVRYSPTHFMCHKKLEIKLGRRINFINGANGSGKSAILAAMQICLGASAKQTHRGNKLGDLVREGSDATAEVVVKLVNEGTDAFRHETYGDTIGIRRRFGKKGGGKLDMLNENDDKVTSDRKELRSLLDSLKISVDNPVCVLDQENSKHFIRGKAKDKYKFFLRATEIQDVMERIKRATNAADKCISDAEHQRTKLESFARLAQNAQREYEEVMRLAKYDEEIRDLKVRVGVLTPSS